MCEKNYPLKSDILSKDPGWWWPVSLLKIHPSEGVS